jgi:hypothetical protein
MGERLCKELFACRFWASALEVRLFVGIVAVPGVEREFARVTWTIFKALTIAGRQAAENMRFRGRRLARTRALDGRPLF